MHSFRVGLVGCGAIFPMHAHSVKQIAQAEIVAVCDRERERAEQQAMQFGGMAYTDFEDMIQNAGLNVVHICTPHYLHASMSIYALEHGVHVVVEKPMSIAYGDAQQMVAAQSKRGAQLEVIFQNRYNAATAAIEDVLNSGKLGKVLGARSVVAWNRPDSYYRGSDWKGTWDKEGGSCIINQSIHTLDLMRRFVGAAVLDVDAAIAQRCNSTTDTEDTAEGIVTFTNGVRGLFYFTNCNSYNAPVEIVLHCENGIVHMVGNQADITYDSGETEHISPDTNKQLLYGDGAKGYWGSSHFLQIRRFYDSLLGHAERIPVEEALKTQQLVCMIYHNAKKNF